MEIGISLLSLLFVSRACHLKRHGQKTQWEWRHFKLTAQTRGGGAGGWKSKRHRPIVENFHLWFQISSCFTFFARVPLKSKKDDPLSAPYFLDHPLSERCWVIFYFHFFACNWSKGVFLQKGYQIGFWSLMIHQQCFQRSPFSC